MSTNPGFTGTGYLGFFGQTGEKLTWSFTAPNGAGAYTVTFRYRAISTATRVVSVNGVSQGTLTLAKNANAFTDNTWSSSAPITVTLPAGVSTLELAFSGTSFTGYADVDSTTLAGGGTGKTVTPSSVATVATVPGVSISTALVANAQPIPGAVATVAVVPAIAFTRTANVTALAVVTTATIDIGLYGNIPIINATVGVAAITCTATIPIDGYDIEALRMLAGRYRLLGNTRQRITG